MSFYIIFGFYFIFEGENPSAKRGDVNDSVWAIPGQDGGWNTEDSSADIGGTPASHHG